MPTALERRILKWTVPGAVMTDWLARLHATLTLATSTAPPLLPAAGPSRDRTIPGKRRRLARRTR